MGGRSIDGNTKLTTPSAELYDPATNSWTPAAPLNEARFSHTATVLPSGHVLVAGGRGVASVTASVEVYDPDTDTWTIL